MKSVGKIVGIAVPLLLFAQVIKVVHHAFQASFGDVRKECRTKTGVSWDALRQFKRGGMEQNDPKLKCYLKCFMVKNGIANENNEIAVDRAVRHLPKQIQDSSRRVLEKCRTMRGKDSCDTAYEIAKCYFKSQPEVLKRIALV